MVTTLSESIGASTVVKAYKAENFYMKLFDHRLDPLISASIVKDSMDTWVTCRAELISAIIVLSCGALYVGDLISPVQAGLALSTAITFTKNVYLLLWALIQVEVEMNSVERLSNYINNIPCEEKGLEQNTPYPAWPADGRIDLQDVTLQYRTQPRPALDKVNLRIDSGQRVGLVGRTGSGKSSLVSTMSRLIEISSGQINIAGVDIAHLPLQQLRSAVHVLPQEPLLFEGTLRENLDPHELHTDTELWRALDLCGLSESFRREDGEKAGLGTHVSFGGANLSAGQMQLICMARAIVHKPRILIIDEATASVDGQSDKLIQHSLQTEFEDTTIVCIAHRIATLTWMDQIVVMDEGKIVEKGSPRSLLLDHDSAFRGLMATHGEKFLQEAIVSSATAREHDIPT